MKKAYKYGDYGKIELIERSKYELSDWDEIARTEVLSKTRVLWEFHGQKIRASLGVFILFALIATGTKLIWPSLNMLTVLAYIAGVIAGILAVTMLITLIYWCFDDILW